MFIKSVSYQNKSAGWGFERIDFHPFTLLVGLSGAGKSRILSAVARLKDIKNGKTDGLFGTAFEIEFSHKNKDFFWSGEFEQASGLEEKTDELGLFSEKTPKFLKERLLCGEKEIFLRENGKCFLNKTALPEFSPYQSALKVFVEQEDIIDASYAFDNLFLTDFFMENNVPTTSGTADYFSRNKGKITIYDVARSNLSVVAKLAFLFLNEPEEFLKVKEKFLDFFPYVEDLFFENDFNGRYFLLKIKEKHTGTISQKNFSSGMFKTIVFLTQMAMLSGECVVLIDEIENSLGLNCIDILIEEASHENRDDQFLVTSHHPYIINNTDLENIKIVTRVGGKVSVREATEVLTGKSSHEAFFRLINASAYNEGIKKQRYNFVPYLKLVTFKKQNTKIVKKVQIII